MYLRERRKVVKRIKKYYTKTSNCLNAHGEVIKQRGESNYKYSICNQEEDYIHIVHCATEMQERRVTLGLIKAVKYEEYNNDIRRSVLNTMEEFFEDGEYEKKDIKMLLRGWICKEHREQRYSKWVQDTIQIILDFYH